MGEHKSARRKKSGQTTETVTPARMPLPRPHPLRRLPRQAGNQALQHLLQESQHNSPPTSGPGSRQAPLLLAETAQQRVAAMMPDIYYRSPVNPDNPVLVWTDGHALFFGPSQAQVDAGRLPAEPEPRFTPPPGYAAAELHWDRNDISGLGAGGAGGPLVVVARQAGQPDLVVTITNTLHQRSSSLTGSGLSGSARFDITREGTEFFLSDESTVPLAISGAAAPGPIHGITFNGGFIRYRAAGGDHDLYVEQGETINADWEDIDPEMAAYLVERATGAITRRYDRGSVASVFGNPDGTVQLETGSGPARQTDLIDLRRSPPTVSSSQGHTTGGDPARNAAMARLTALDVTFRELRTRMSTEELEAIEDALTRSGNHGLQTLRDFRREILGDTTQPLLEVTKVINVDQAVGGADPSGPPTLHIQEPFDTPAPQRAATIRHEMTHILVGCIDELLRSRMPRQARANLEGAMRFEARRARDKARAGRLRMGEYGRGDRVPPPGTARQWRGALGHDPELASVWVELLQRYSFIPDPEGTAELRGVSLADESRYLGIAEQTGHPADSVDEFIASFVTCALQVGAAFTAAVLAAETAGNARGGGGGSYLRRLYRRAWQQISDRYVPLGANPF